jgi:hypothetical protein
MGYIIMEKYLSDIVNNIEKSNNTEFPDPFYELEGKLLKMCENYLDYRKIMKDYKAFHMFLSDLENLNVIILRIVNDYSLKSFKLANERTDGFLSKVFGVLADNAEQMTFIISDIIEAMHETEGDMNIDDFKEIESLYMELAVLVAKTSQSIDSYYIDNLWK